MAFRLHWAGSGVFLATEVRVQLHEWLAILTGTLTPGALIVFVAILAPELLPVTLVGALVYSMFLIGQRVLNEAAYVRIDRSEEHTSELQSRVDLVCRLLLEKKKNNQQISHYVK